MNSKMDLKKTLLEHITMYEPVKKGLPKSYIQILQSLEGLSEKEIHQKLFEFIGLIETMKKIPDPELVKKRVWDYPIFHTVRDEMLSEIHVMENPPELVSGLIRCKYCKSDKTYSYNVQTRSADEGMTTFCACTVCGKRFRTG